jgi:uncharacterized protein
LKIEHLVVVDGPRAELEALLEDVPRVARCVPGVEHVEHLGGDSYGATVRLRLGPVNFAMKGTVTLEASDGAWTLRGEGKDVRLGAGVKGTVTAVLEEPAPGRTVLMLSADLRFFGRLAEVGQPPIRAKAAATMHEFGVNLQRALSAQAR